MSFTQVTDAAKKLVDSARTWVDPNGARLSDRLWLARQRDRAAIDKILRTAVVKSRPVDAVAEDLTKYLRAPYRREAEDGKGHYAARRLSRTELNRAQGEAVKQEVARETNTQERWAVKWNTRSGGAKDSVCQKAARESSRKLPPGVYWENEVPPHPGHPNCVCYLTPYDVDREKRKGMGDLNVNEFANDFNNPQQAYGGSTRAHLIPDGKGGIMFTPERQKLHDDLVRDFTDRAPVSANKTLHMLGGGPAAGKSSILKSGKINVPEEHYGAVLVNPDEMKERLPEYGTMLRDKIPKAASFVHEESSYLAKRVMKAAAEKGQDILVDGVGVNFDKMKKAAGPDYDTKGYYVFVDNVDTAVDRAAARELKTGRGVPEDYIREKHWEVSQIFPKAVDALAEIELYDTSEGDPVLVGEGGAGDFTVFDPERWKRFRDLSSGPKPAVEPL